MSQTNTNIRKVISASSLAL